MALQPASPPAAEQPPHADTIAHRSYLSRVSSQRQGSLLVEQIPLTKIPGMLSLGGGMPNPTMFPFASVEVRSRSRAAQRYLFEILPVFACKILSDRAILFGPRLLESCYGAVFQ
jgi:hypothetical protein